jgi:L-asparaginase II
MPFSNQFSYEQTIILRTALDLVVAKTRDGDDRLHRAVVAAVLIEVIHEDEDLDAETLARLAIDKMNEKERKTG